MSDKKTVLVVFGYSDGSYDHAVGEHAEEVWAWIRSCESMQFAHGGKYRGRIMVEVPPRGVGDLEPIHPIAERTFPEWVEELARNREDQ